MATEGFSVSVVIPAYNAADTLPRALRSALEQTYAPLEVIVVDDGSTDGTATVAERFQGSTGPPVLVLRQQNQGPSAARNSAIKSAAGEFVAFLDADDRWFPEKLEHQVDLMQREGTRFSATGFHYYAVAHDHEGSEAFTDWRPDRAAVLDRMLVRNCIMTTTVCVARDLLDNAGLFDPAISYGEDYDLWMRIIGLGAMVSYVPLPLADYTPPIDSLTSRSQQIRRTMYIPVMKALFENYELPDEVVRRRRWYMANRHLNEAVSSLAGRDHKRALAELSLASWARPASVRPGWLIMASRAITGIVNNRLRDLRRAPGAHPRRL